MAKRKYARYGEKPIAYQCTNRKCKWEGKDEEKNSVELEDKFWASSELVCPKCGNNEFYGLI